MFRKIIVLTALLALLPLQAKADEVGPLDAVKYTVGQVIDVLKARKDQKSLSEADRAAIRKAVSVYFDFGEMAKRALARPWRDLNPAQKKEFVADFRQLLELTYGNRLANFHNQSIEYGEVQQRGRIAAVDTNVIDADKKTPVRYKLVHKKVGWRVYDIQVEGISMVNTFRTDFTEAVHKDGIEGFLKSLKQRVAGLQTPDQDKVREKS